MPATPIFEKKNVLVTGGAGFIGSHLSERLVRDAKVICLDSFINSDERNIELLLQNPDFEFIKWNTTEKFSLDQFPELEKFKVKFQGVQEIYHLACPTSAKNFDKYRMETLLSNGAGTRHVLDIATEYRSKVVFASSSVVYGPRHADGSPFVESDQGAVNQLSPRACYDEGKRFAETVIETYRQVHGLDAKSARIFRTYGPRQRLFDGEMISDFIVNALEGKDLVIYGDQNFDTSLTFVSDIVDGLIRLMRAPSDTGPVNFGQEQSVKLVDVANLIIKLTNASSKVVFEPPLLFMTPLGLPSIKKAKEDLGWLPLVRLEDGLKRSIDYALAHKVIITH